MKMVLIFENFIYNVIKQFIRNELYMRYYIFIYKEPSLL